MTRARNIAIGALVVLTLASWVLLAVVWWIENDVRRIREKCDVMSQNIAERSETAAKQLEKSALLQLQTDYQSHLERIQKDVSNRMTKVEGDNNQALVKLAGSLARFDKALEMFEKEMKSPGKPAKPPTPGSGG